MNKRWIGSKNEDMAIQKKKKKGYEILERNWYHFKREIDIIARDKNQIVFIEVKSRKNDLYGDPEDAVNLKKQKIIIGAANSYIEKHQIDLEARFDIISILFKNHEPEIKHIVDAFHPQP